MISVPMASSDSIDHFVRSYGDLLFDLCESVLWNPMQSQIAFRAILKKVRSRLRFQKYSQFERSWVLRIAYEKLLKYCKFYGYTVSSEEQIQMDSNQDLPTRLQQFDSYFHRLSTEDQILLLLKDKYGIPFSEISDAMNIPEGSLRVRRQQALRTLEEWLWNSK